MDEEVPPDKPMTPEVSKFLDGNVSYLALSQMTSPLRDAEIVLTSVLIDTLVALRSLPLEGEGKERVDRAWEKLNEVFLPMDLLEERTARIFSGRHPWDKSGDEKE
ncbi:hypothetical protein [Pseudomonas kitaguniensis]|uniref:hypothetical protein n=1 Tax=Pseudomonas kitaguniensis TaxID=2607908 RepID=UPI003B9E7E08